MNQVTLPVKNMQEAVGFYVKLGFVQIVSNDGYARFMCPGNSATFSLSLVDGDVRNGTVIYFEHEQLDTWVDQLLDKGIIFEQMPTDMPYLWREAVLYDPSGNCIKLYWAGKNRLNPPWKLT